MAEYKTTYYLGAGASAMAVPIIGELERAFRWVKTWINEHGGMNPHGQKLMDAWLSVAALNTKTYGTIDTFAKKLSFTHPKDLEKMKAGLIVFFLLWQELVKGRVSEDVRHPKRNEAGQTIAPFKEIDPRYLGLVANYLSKNEDGSFEIDDNIRIITWNYDCQLEKAIALFTDQEVKDVISKFKVYPPFPGAIGTHKSKIVHLNGIAGLYDIENSGKEKETKSLFFSPEDKDAETYLQKLLAFAVDAEIGKVKHYSHLTYAWENDPYSKGAIDEATEIMWATDVLVIIGYSFPTFNNAIDKTLMEIARSKAKRIFYQDPRASYELLTSRFDLKKEIISIVDKQLDQFVLPLDATSYIEPPGYIVGPEFI